MAAALNAGLQHVLLDDELSIPQAMELAFKAVSHDGEPQSFAEAMQRPDKDKWYKAALDEMESLIENGTWDHLL